MEMLLKEALAGKLTIITNSISQRKMEVATIETTAVKEVRKALEGQVQAWNQGNLEQAMTFYWESADMLWISKSGVDRGYTPVLESFRRDFSDRNQMGVYTYESLHIEEVSSEAVYYVFRRRIELNGKQLMGGVSSQLWKKIDDNWVITAEHTS